MFGSCESCRDIHQPRPGENCQLTSPSHPLIQVSRPTPGPVKARLADGGKEETACLLMCEQRRAPGGAEVVVGSWAPFIEPKAGQPKTRLFVQKVGLSV